MLGFGRSLAVISMLQVEGDAERSSVLVEAGAIGVLMFSDMQYNVC